jgi:hypothetical protein
MFKFLFILCSILFVSQSLNLVYYSNLPVSRLALFKALLSMSYLKNDLDRTFKNRFQNKMLYYARTKLTEGYLKDVSA